MKRPPPHTYSLGDGQPACITCTLPSALSWSHAGVGVADNELDSGYGLKEELM